MLLLWQQACPFPRGLFQVPCSPPMPTPLWLLTLLVGSVAEHTVSDPWPARQCRCAGFVRHELPPLCSHDTGELSLLPFKAKFTCTLGPVPPALGALPYELLFPSLVPSNCTPQQPFPVCKHVPQPTTPSPALRPLTPAQPSFS